jgi:hypothetical protein
VEESGLLGTEESLLLLPVIHAQCSDRRCAGGKEWRRNSGIR